MNDKYEEQAEEARKVLDAEIAEATARHDAKIKTIYAAMHNAAKLDKKVKYRIATHNAKIKLKNQALSN